MVSETGTAGNKGSGIRSDCHVFFQLKNEGGIDISISSKVNNLFGDKIDWLATEILSFFEIEHANLEIEDFGALDFVLAARIESAIKKVVDSKKEYLLPLIEENVYQTGKDSRRFSRLYLPGNSPKLFLNAGLHKPDGVILDLEDSVAPDKKEEARFIVRNALRQVNFYGAEKMVRINQLPLGLEDLDFIVPQGVNLILIPKVEEMDQILDVEDRITEIKEQKNITNDIWLMPIIESALGVVNAYEIASASPNIVALAIGLEDYTADLGASRTQEAWESFFARGALVNAAKAAGIQAIDSVFSDVDDMEGLAETIKTSKSLGFEGMGCIHPRQIPVIHEFYAPDEKEIDKAKKIVLAFEEANSKGLGVVSLGSKMIDPPVVKRAIKIINAAIDSGKLDKNWIELK
jgi:citrate lyase subunit beta/citryl-CoA lyase